MSALAEGLLNGTMELRTIGGRRLGQQRELPWPFGLTSRHRRSSPEPSLARKMTPRRPTRSRPRGSGLKNR